jgi:hypothetical protein
MTQTKFLTEYLKQNWISYYKADQLVRSGNGQRRVREIRECPPAGYKMIEKKVKEPVWHKEFKLVGVETC